MKLFSKQLFWIACAGVTLLGGVQNAAAQDQRYSQYYTSPARLNPALAGVFDGAFRLGLNYRTQWGSNMYKGYNSGSFTADGKTAVFKDDYLGFGFNAMYDVAGVGNYGIMELGLDVNYQKKLYQGRGALGKDYSQFLIAGAHLGLGQRSINWEKLTYSEQWDPEYTGGNGSWSNYYNPNMTSGENMSAVRQNRLYPELHAGLLWYGTFGKRRSAYGGASIYHINRPDISLFWRPPVDSAGNSYGSPIEKLPMRFTLHGGGEIQVGGRGSSISILPGFVAMFQGPSMEINFGMGIKYQAPKYDDFALRLAIWNRLSNQYRGVDIAGIGEDAMVVHIGLDFNQFRFGFSYDATFSKLMVVNNTRGSFEFSMFYIFPGDSKRRQGCPTF